MAKHFRFSFLGGAIMAVAGYLVGRFSRSSNSLFQPLPPDHPALQGSDVGWGNELGRVSKKELADAPVPPLSM